MACFGNILNRSARLLTHYAMKVAKYDVIFKMDCQKNAVRLCVSSRVFKEYVYVKQL